MNLNLLFLVGNYQPNKQKNYIPNPGYTNIFLKCLNEITNSETLKMPVTKSLYLPI